MLALFIYAHMSLYVLLCMYMALILAPDIYAPKLLAKWMSIVIATVLILDTSCIQVS